MEGRKPITLVIQYVRRNQRLISTMPRVPEGSRRLGIADTAYMLYAWAVTGLELLKLLRANGWELDRIRGSHHILVKGTKTVSVPVHGSKDIPKGTLKAILKEADI
jgi:predicted RNA binding protein YcfA (HicA-like mRNA interferase family)